MKQITSFFAVVVFIFLSVPFNLLGEEQDAGNDLTPMVIQDGAAIIGRTWR